MARRLALLVATYRYSDTGLRQLTTPAHDAEAFAAVLADREIAGFEVTTLINEPHHVVGQAIGDFYRGRRRDDLTLLYFTGHGLKDDDGRLYLAMTNTLRDNLLFTGLPADQVDHAMESCQSRQKVLILDCCYSGAFGRTKADTAVHALERFHGRGRTVLTASDATQYSFEGDRPHGESTQSVFTRHLVAGLRDGSADLDGDGDITLDELYTYVHDKVIEEQPRQRPKKQDNVEGRTVIARNVSWTLPAYLRHSIASPIAADRLAALDGLAHLRRVGNDVVRAHAEEEIRRLADDDSKQVSAAATSLLPEHEPEPEPEAEPEPEPQLEPAPPPPVVEPAPLLPPASPEASHPRPALKPKQVRTAIVAFLALCLVAGTIVLIKALSGSSSSGGDSSAMPDVLTGVQPDVGSIQFSPNGNLLATTAGNTTELWNVGDGKKIASRADARSVAFSPDSKKLAVLHEDSSVRLWDVPDNKVIAELGRYEGLAVFAFNPDGAVLAVAGTLVAKEAYDNPIVLWDTASGKQLRTLAGHTNGVQSMVFSSHGVLASGAAGGAVRLWDVKTGQNTAAYTAGYTVAFSDDGQTLATSSEFASDQKVQLWNIATATVRTSFGKGEPVAFGQDGRTLLVHDRWNEHPNAALWDVRSAMSITMVTEHAMLSPDGRTLAHGSSTGTITLFDVASRTPSRTLTGHTGAITDLAFRPDSRLLATSSKDGTVRLWPIA